MFVKYNLKLKITRGFTLIELMAVMGIFSLIAGFASINLIKPQASASLDTTVSTLIADLKEQQIRAMTGDGASSYGIRFEPNSYILFTGSIYPSPIDNFTIDLEPGLQISPTPITIVFAQRSGETVPSGASVTFTIANNSSGEQKTINVNSLGVIQE